MDPYLFSGLRVIDCATVIAAPAAAMILADFGADVIKIEAPGEGDMLRMLSEIDSTPDGDGDWFWQLDGRNKRGMQLDMKTAGGQQVLHRLVRSADVFITNQPYPVREALNITYDDLQPLNPRLIYASLTAYGEQGAERDRKGFDQLAYWARSGLMDLMREPGTMPAQGLPGMGDHPTAVALYASIVTALLHRERTGEGSMAHTSLLANGMWSAAGILQGALANGDMAGYRTTNRVYNPMLRPYETADGRWLQCNMIRDEELLSLFLVAIDAANLLADPRFGDLETMFGPQREALGDEIAGILATKPAAEWMTLFEAHDLPVNLVGIIEESVVDTQAQVNDIAITSDDPAMPPRLVNHPVRASNVPQVGPRRAPAPGEHTNEILAELGYSAAEIQELRAGGAI
ncbi:MAG: CaiB/BaiF CoA-transferase family protein [Actinomycetota bacterium]